jgi:predicted NUDIX family NTP pyrophosphohydrolase
MVVLGAFSPPPPLLNLARQARSCGLCDHPRHAAADGLPPRPSVSVSSAVSGGILLYRLREGALELLLAHPGGPYWSTRDDGAWTIPKGVAERGEELASVAIREFTEETGFDLASISADPSDPRMSLGGVTLKSGKVVEGWAVEGDLDPSRATSNETEIQWPPRSGRRLVIPEIDRVAWFDAAEARRRIHPAQAAFIDRLEAELASREAPGG